jgi:monooxygenase
VSECANDIITLLCRLGERSLAAGSTILSYIHHTSEKYNVKKHILCNRWVNTVSFSSDTNQWTLLTQHKQRNNDVVFDDELASGSLSVESFTCSFMFNCSGYYNYDAGYTPSFPGVEKYTGLLVHPQHWPKDLDYTNKKVVIIGSGATAVTLLPAMADKVKHITMLQRSPTYIASVSLIDPVATFLHSIPFLPTKWAHFLIRWKNILGTMLIFWQAKTWPSLTKKYLKHEIKSYLGSESTCDVEKHFSPSYDPWDQRLCAVPDNDFFKAIKEGKADVVTDQIDTFTESGIKLKDSKEELSADIVITATGLVLQLFGGMKMFIDGKPVDMTNTRVYKGVMLSNIPNAAMSVG